MRCAPISKRGRNAGAAAAEKVADSFMAEFAKMRRDASSGFFIHWRGNVERRVTRRSWNCLATSQIKSIAAFILACESAATHRARVVSKCYSRKFSACGFLPKVPDHHHQRLY